MLFRAIIHASLSILVTEYLVGHFAGALVFHEIDELHKLTDHTILLLDNGACASLYLWQLLERARAIMTIIIRLHRASHVHSKVGLLVSVARHHVLSRHLRHVCLICDIALRVLDGAVTALRFLGRQVQLVARLDLL